MKNPIFEKFYNEGIRLSMETSSDGIKFYLEHIYDFNNSITFNIPIEIYQHDPQIVNKVLLHAESYLIGLNKILIKL